jgi:glycosyltransferase involved in cell wall biosynthesis
MQPPRITVVTPSYNQAKYLCATIESILNQDYPNLEYMIVDGGSTDGSVDIIKRYESHLSHWVSEKDGGQSEAINKAFRKSTGRFFNWINSDDILFPGALWRIAETIIKYPDADMVVGDHAQCDAAGQIIWVSAASSQWSRSPSQWVMLMGQQSTFVASHSYRRVQGVREDLHISMDMDLYYRVCRGGAKVVRVPGVIGVIRKHPETKGSTAQPLWRQEQAGLFREYGISPALYRRALLGSRLRRFLDGSYVRSCALLYRWKGKRPWDNDGPERFRPCAFTGTGADS